MTADQSLLLWLGFHLPELIAGLGGGACAVAVMGQSKPKQIMGSLVVGALTANYLGNSAVHVLVSSMNLVVEPTVASFGVGLLGTPICQTIMERFQARAKLNAGAKDVAGG